MTKYLVFIFVFLGCKNVDFSIDRVEYPIHPVEHYYDDELQIERINSQKKNRLLSDNIVYNPCKQYEYKFTIIKNDVEYLGVMTGDETEGWIASSSFDLIEKDSIGNREYVDRVLVSTPLTIPPNTSIDYSVQSVTKRSWMTSDGIVVLDLNEGIIENYSNIWIHPDRFLFMWPTFTAPWPYIKFPLKVGSEYTWSLKLDGGWCNDDYVKWDGIVKFNFKYKIAGVETINLANKKVECYIIEAFGSSTIGETSVKFYFNPEIGFVRSHYILMDKSEIILFLSNVIIDCDFELE